MLTKIEAVNRMLASVQLRPVQSLEEPLDPIVAQAKLNLEQELKDLQQKRWEWNIETDRTFTYDTSTGEVAIPTDVLAIDFSGAFRTTERMTVRGRKIYDAANRTFNIGKNLDLTVMVELTFEDAPYAMQVAAMWRGARILCTNVRGEKDQIRSIAAKEMESFAELMSQDIRNADPWIGNSSLIGRTITRRRKRWTWVS